MPDKLQNKDRKMMPRDEIRLSIESHVAACKETFNAENMEVLEKMADDEQREEILTFLKEKMNKYKWAGIALIIIGVSIIL